jgi:orotidine-5'-phosphate decarboxylase
VELSFNKRLQSICEAKSNSLCIGLDIDPDKFPSGADTSLLGMESFAKDVIDGSIDFCPMYKPNFAFFERFGSQGFALLERLVAHINGRAIVIADAKRGDIGNTSRQYATAILDGMGCDAITVSPYMGRDAIKPFIENPEKGVFVLAVTSNQSASEIQEHGNQANPLYKKVIQISMELNTNDNIGLVVGATKTEIMEEVRKLSNGMPWLIPGVGTQGGDLESALKISHKNGLGIINVSRGILYAGDGSLNDVIQAAKNYTEKIRSIVWNPVNC